MGLTVGNCCQNDKINQGELKVETKIVDKTYTPPEKVSPIPSVCQRYRQLRGDDSWLKNKEFYHLQNNKGIYYGNVSNNLPNGQGKLICSDGSYYEGDFFNGTAHTSKGLYIYPDGSYYFGEIRNNKAEGKGTFVFKLTGDLKYQGQWLDDMPHGRGTEDLIDRSHYQGDFKCGIKAGSGIFVWPNGDKYKGQFEGGMIHGEGSFQSNQTNYRYVGNWSKNKKQGKGVQYFDEGKIIQSDFENGNRIGQLKVTMNGKTLTGRESEGKFQAD